MNHRAAIAVIGLIGGAMALSGCGNSRRRRSCEACCAAGQSMLQPSAAAIPPPDYAISEPEPPDAGKRFQNTSPPAVSGDGDMLQFLSAAATGETRTFQDTSWGPIVQATAGEHYHTALGGMGRNATLLRLDDQASVPLALTQTRGRWEFGPDIRAFFRRL